jgi:uncharacterized protein YndB with AHSA1/START domain
MNKPLFVKNWISINAPATKVWDVLVNPEQTKKYMFGCETVSDWKKGSSLLWKGQYEGKDMIFVKGIIKEILPEKMLTYTVIDPNASYPDVPANYLDVTYALSSHAGKTDLQVVMGDFSTVAEGEKRYKETDNNGVGWTPILEEIKKLAESKN